MKYTSTLLALAVATCSFFIAVNSAPAQGTAFTYQGRLNDGGSPAHGAYDLRFKLYADSLGSTQIGGSFLTNAIPVTNGLFVTTINFGAGIFNGSNYWLEVAVKTNGAGSYTVLTPSQAVTPTPYAMFANTASNLSGTLPTVQLSGTIANGNLPASPSFSGNVTATGGFAGNGANVTNVNAASLGGLSSLNFWKLGGNNVAAGQFIGSTNNQPLELWVNGQRGLRLESTVGGGPNLIAGYSNNFVNPGVFSATIAGGGQSGSANHVGSSGGTIGGGNNNAVNNISGTVSGGANNTAGQYSTVGGGLNNISSGNWATLGGGEDNDSSGHFGTIGGGFQNTNSGYGAVIGGGGADQNFGKGNLASGAASVVGGGVSNQATNSYATVPGGANNIAGGKYSFAAGDSAQAIHDGAFVWADFQGGVFGIPFGSTSTNQFSVRANGGVRFVTGGAGMTLDGQPVLTNNQSGVTLNGTLGGNGGGLTNITASQLGGGTVFSKVQAGQAIMPSSLTVATNFTVTFPQAFSSIPKVIASISGDPGFSTASDTFVMSIRAITTTTGFTVNVMRVDATTGWSQQLRINWQAWQ